MRVLVTTYPFGHTDKLPREMLENIFKEIKYNEEGEKLRVDQHVDYIKEFQPDIIIAGTENYDARVLDVAKNLKMISRVGIGLDSVDLKECKKRNIVVTYTPDAPSNAVADLTICQIINMLRKIQDVSEMLQRNKWNRYIGREIMECNVGIIGMGRIGSKVYHRLLTFEPKKLYYNEIKDKEHSAPLEQIIKECDVISLHIPLKDDTIDNKDFITAKELYQMKPDVRLLNMSRGGIINEEDLFQWLTDRPKSTAAIDTFNNESYHGKLIKLKNAYLTPHLGSCTVRSRLLMEGGAVQEAIQFIKQIPLRNKVV